MFGGILILTFSEFGCHVKENANIGANHETINNIFKK